MKPSTLDNFIIVSKGFAYILVGIFTPWIAALAQWANSGDNPPRIIWLGVILPLSMIGAGNAWIAFTSSSWKEYREQRKADISGEVQTTEVKPQSAAASPDGVKT